MRGSNSYWLTRGALFLVGLGVMGAWVGMTLSPLVIPWEPPPLLYAGGVLALLAAISLVAIIVADVANEVGPSEH